VDFVDHIMEWSRSVPIFVVTLARPDLLDKRPAWGAAKRNFTSVYLEPLTTDIMRLLLRSLVPDMPETALASILARAEGMPLYAVETVRMLIAQGRLAIEDGVCQPVGDLTTVAVPETLTALVSSRLDALAPSERALTSDAAVLGQSFTQAGLVAVSGVPEADLEPMLRQLVRRELLTQDLDPRSPERGQYSFVQALIREVAYNTLARRDRKTRHLAAARFFESLGTDELAGALASHYLAAHENASEPAEADALARQARIALQAAADRAIALGSYEQALRFLRSALTVASDPSEEADLLDRAGRAATEAALLDEGERLLRRAIDLRRSMGDMSGLAGSLVAITRTLVGAYRSEEAIALLEPVMKEMQAMDDEVAIVRLASAMSSAYALHQDIEPALALIDRYMGDAERLDLIDVVVTLLMRRGMLLGQIGRSYEASALTRGALELAETHGLVGLAMACRGNLGFQLNERDTARALELDRETLAETRRLGMRQRMLLMLGNCTEEARHTADWDWALEELAPQLAGELDRPDRAWLLGNALVIGSLRGEASDEEWEEWEALIVGHDDPQAAADYADIRSLRALAEGRLSDARRFAIDGFSIVGGRPSRRAVAARAALWSGDRDGAATDLDAIDATAVHGPAAELRRAGVRGGVAALEGRTAEAIAQFRIAREGFRDIGLPWEEALVGIDMATLLDPREPEVTVAATRSREIMIALRAQPFLDRLDTAMAVVGQGSSAAVSRPEVAIDRAVV
jgi:tetratricopeptide (TPR) repeat protein